MTPRNAHRLAVYSTGLNRAWGISRTAKITGLTVWAAATLALASGPREIVKTVEIDRPFPHLDLAACRDLVSRNARAGYAAPHVPPTQHTSIEALQGVGVYNPKDAPVITARIRARSAERIARERNATAEQIARERNSASERRAWISRIRPH